jgi:hypothetical protein
VECVEYAEALAESEALIADLECLSKEVPDAKRHAGNFELPEAVKSVPLDPSNDACRQVRIGSELDCDTQFAKKRSWSLFFPCFFFPSFFRVVHFWGWEFLGKHSPVKE